ncbi:hypothetical protein TraAM80_01854 [Trypanosoma rangeli]|uniref:J domain-containing protein n=1 Tax=Trypanosoma rangeli TaxID=5698 RepID=A0A3S5IS69_TRYRA|nr:uncharacterized protein TraAM80_01854 [Trypanosoma rangeli]RNF10105.1 hypothetical protein TraAM80_01854 [Trypanosoma rangeli]|eukprot:RNF10105.1 hypothetical protein TraAM80_01854 [Trypanosoma rangeli]
MEAVAKSFFDSGDIKAAATFYCNLMVLHPRYVKMARICRVLADPSAVPLPHRYADIVEAILDPAVTHGALFGAGAMPADVNKAYQRWTLLVHPDKNPYPRAGDAFKRLLALKTLALEMADAVKDKTHHANSSHDGRRPNGRSDAPAAPNRQGANMSTAAKASLIDATLSEMKKRQVTLKSLKRKNIDDSELPALRTTLRDVRERRFCLRSTTPLASTEPCIPTQSFTHDQSASLTHSFPSHLPRPAVDEHISLAPFSLPRNNTLLGTARVEGGELDGSFTAGSLHCVPSVTAVEEQSEEILAEEDMLGQRQVAENVGLEVAQSTDVKEANETIAMYDAGGGISTAKVTDLSVSPPTSIAHDGEWFTDAVKGSIRHLIQGIQEMRTNRAPLRLNCDLTFAAYERERRQKREDEMSNSMAE